ncbi:DNA mismatch repair protein MutS [Paenibacillus sp.]|uniref:endonuclease MutS2 n=1 Tax=Paenibacillus sp. TaxID=58172 RepID=UPI0028117279|nr:DNA mismatch repair protein MutS [Paenibacillus sp.]
MNERTMARLEYMQVVERLTEYTVTYLGKALAEKLQPMTELGAVRSLLAETAEASELLKLGASVPLPSLEGMETVFQLIGTGYVFTEADFGAILTFLTGCGQLRRYMDSKKQQAPRVTSYANSLYDLAEVRREIDRCIRHGRVDDAASGELAKIRKHILIAEDRMKKRLDALMTKHKSILQEAIVAKRGNRYVLPVKKEHRRLVQGAVLDESASGQTVYIEPAELAALQYELGDLRAEEAREETKVLALLTGLVEDREAELRLNAETVGAYDFLFAKAKYARAIDGVWVEANDAGVVDVRGARHPLLGGGMVPLDFSIGQTYRALIITGPNTGGKTVALKTIGLLTLMVQSGLLVPVAAGSTFAVFRRFSADIGDGQSLEQSLSTFSAHVKMLVETLRTANGSTLVLIDEMASGTDPGEGVGLSIAVLEELYRKGATVVATTHFNEIKRFAAAAPGFENARMEFDTETLEPLYRLRIGEAGHSYAFAIASKLGMPAQVLVRSRELTEGARRRGEDGSAAFEGAIDLPAFVPGKTAEQQPKPAASNETEAEFDVGDCVYIPSLDKYGIVYAAADKVGDVGVLVQKERLKLNRKRLKLHISKTELYPDDYDFDIVFDTKENRKKKKLMSKRHVEGLTIVRSAEDEV